MKIFSILIVLLVLFNFPAFTQESTEKYINPSDPAFTAKYDHLQFNDKFVLLAEFDAANNYFITDFSRLESRFEKVYFLNLTYGTPKIVNLHADLTQNRIWFLSNRKNPEKEIILLFDDLKDQTQKKSSTMNDVDKNIWLKEHDKYK
ncbi:MAG: hypothetical protein WCL00_04010 [Bacteroidota bacterium]